MVFLSVKYPLCPICFEVQIKVSDHIRLGRAISPVRILCVQYDLIQCFKFRYPERLTGKKYSEAYRIIPVSCHLTIIH